VPFTLFESGAKDEKKTAKPKVGFFPGTVVNNCDLLPQGKVLVRVPALGQELSARLVAPGAGPGAGFFYVPRIDDEVLVQIQDNDAYVAGGLWNTEDRPPATTPLDVISKRVIKTGIVPGVGHQVEFDDGPGQSITIMTTTRQKIVLDPTKIELSTTLGTVKITLDLATQSISIQALAPPPGGKIEIKGSQITLQAVDIDIQGIKTTSIKGGMVLINPV
jgi:hypothetical protein